MIYQEVTRQNFIDTIRSVRPDQISTDGLSAIYDYLYNFEEDIELDPLGIFCDFTEYKSKEEASEDLDISIDELETKVDYLETESSIIIGDTIWKLKKL